MTGVTSVQRSTNAGFSANLASAVALTATSGTPSVVLPYVSKSANISLKATTSAVVGGTAPTFTPQVQYSLDGGTTWTNVTGLVTSAIAGAATASVSVAGVAVPGNPVGVGPLLRVNVTFGGTANATSVAFTADISVQNL